MDEKTPLHEKAVEETENKLNIFNLVMNGLIVFLLASGTHMYEPVMSQYIYHRVADSVFGNNTEIKNFTVLAPCFQNTSDKGYILVEQAQEDTSTKMWQLTSVSAGIAVFSNIILGSYSDIVGRKFLFLCPMIGHLLRNAMTSVIIYWHLDINFFYVAVCMDGLFGGGWAMLLATMTYAADNTPPEGSRSLTIIIIECVISLATSAASTATGYFIQNTGFFYPSLTAAAITLFDMVLAAIFIKSANKPDTSQPSSIFNGIRNIKDIYFSGTVLNRALFWLGLLLFFVTSLSTSSGSSLETLFLMNLPFCWSPESMGTYDTISTAVRKTLGVGIVMLLQFCFSDVSLAIIGVLSASGGFVTWSFASVEWMVYVGFPVVAIVGFVPLPIARSILSKRVPSDRQGAIFASMAVIEAICSVVGVVIFNNIYRLTVSSWRGAVYFANACNNWLALFILIALAILTRKQKNLKDRTMIIQETDADRSEIGT